MADAVESWMQRNHFLVRRVHSLLGIVPIGFFLVEHLLTNSLAWFGPERFNEQVHWLHNLHYLLALEIIFIFLPIAVHAIYGVVIVLQAKNNAHVYPYLDNWRFALQRWTGVIAMIFIIVHLGHFRFAHWFGGEVYPGTPDPFGLTLRGFQAIPPGGMWFVIYAVGLIAAVYHFVNGVCTFCITWGITIGERARKRVSLAAAGAGVVLLIWGFMSLAAFRSHEPGPGGQGAELAQATPAVVQRATELGNEND